MKAAPSGAVVEMRDDHHRVGVLDDEVGNLLPSGQPDEVRAQCELPRPPDLARADDLKRTPCGGVREPAQLLLTIAETAAAAAAMCRGSGP